LISYLSSFRGVSKDVATLVVDEYADETIDMILIHPEDVQVDLGLTDKQIDALRNGLKSGDRANELRREFPELSALQVKRLSAMMDDPLSEIRKNPYCLTDIPGVSFQIADAIAQRQGIDPMSPFRVNHGVVHLLKTLYANDLFVDMDDIAYLNGFIRNICDLLKIRFQSYDDFGQRMYAFANMPESPIVLETYRDGKTRLFLRDIYKDLCSFIRYAKDLITKNNTQSYMGIGITPIPNLIREFEHDENMCLTQEQKAAAELALDNQLSIITGGPGRGKTSMIKCIASCWTKQHPKKVILLAPTGKAMNKLKMATDSKFTTMTVDKLLVMCMNMSPAIRKSHPELTPILNDPENAMFIIDESSMLDLQKTTNLLGAFPDCHYVFVGDIDQLPPISPGHILRDMITSRQVPVARLTMPLRQKDGKLILDNADKINCGDTNLQYSIGQMLFVERPEDNEEMLDTIVDAYNCEREEVSDITQLALLCPTRKGSVGVVSVNMKIQDLVCPKVENVFPSQDTRPKRQWMSFVQKGYEIPNTIYGNGSDYTRFRVGDIVMNTKNDYSIMTYTYENNDYWNGDVIDHANGIFNGDCGRIIAYIPEMCCDANGDSHDGIVVQFFDGRCVELDHLCGEFESFELGYALTVHKSQGCEYESVIFVAPKKLTTLINIGFTNKNLAYTAVTRAKKRVMIVGSKDGLDACITHSLLTIDSTIANRLNY